MEVLRAYRFALDLSDRQRTMLARSAGALEARQEKTPGRRGARRRRRISWGVVGREATCSYHDVQ